MSGISGMSRRARLFWHYWERIGILAVLLLTLAIFALLTPGIFTVNNLLTVLSRSAIVGIPAMGMTFAICAGGFDLSVGSIVGLSTCVWAANLPAIGIIPATLLTLAVGCACGLLNGLAIAKLKIQTFVATLAMNMIFRGSALVYTDGSKQMISRSENIEAKIFSQNFNIAGLQVQLTPLLLMAAVFAGGYFVYRFTRFGVYARSIGSNELSARTSGVPADRTIIFVFILTGATASISALITASQLMQGAATFGVGFELDVITAAILGGTSLSGGKGNIWGSLIAAVMLTLARNGLNILGLPEEHQRLAIGVILLLSLTVSGVRELMKEASQ